MRIILLLILFMFLYSKSEASVQVLRWPSNTPVRVCIPFDTDPGCGSGSITIYLKDDSSNNIMDNSGNLIIP